MVDDDDSQAPTGRAEPKTEAADPASGPGPFEDMRGVELPLPGYRLGETIGRGGMGEVIAAHDQRIGRDVAFKRMRAERTSQEGLVRFLREARIQARLDHPAIVPVYEIGTDAEMRPYFTMKRLAGDTLAHRLAADPPPPRQQLLHAFVEICLAIELAHGRGVVHRDLKPANIMLGEYGEVYVLDWGVARVGTEDEAALDPGALLGTAGYMAPEQMQSAADVGPAADVYALGAILFEILAGEALHPQGEAAFGSTLGGDHGGPARRRPERAVPPELDAACTAALAYEPAARPSARGLAERVQRYLEGDRDLERRRALAAELLGQARALLAAGRPADRGDAVNIAGRALALDPDSRDAAELVTRLLVEPPTELPPELERVLAAAEGDRARIRGHNAARAYALLLPLSVFVPFLRVEHWGALVAVYVGVLALVGLGLYTFRTGRIRTGLVLAGGIAMSVIMSRIAGPFVLVPTILCGTLFSVTALPWVRSRLWLVIAWTAVAAMAPLLLEWSGVLAPTSTVIAGHLGMRSAIFDTHGTIDLVALVCANVGFLLTAAFFALSVNRDRRRADRELQIRAWHLRKLLPGGHDG